MNESKAFWRWPFRLSDNFINRDEFYISWFTLQKFTMIFSYYLAKIFHGIVNKFLVSCSVILRQICSTHKKYLCQMCQKFCVSMKEFEVSEIIYHNFPAYLKILRHSQKLPLSTISLKLLTNMKVIFCNYVKFIILWI